MIKKAYNNSDTKERIKSFFNKNVEVKVNVGRNKYVYYNGIVTNIYPSLFTITPTSDYKGKTSFSYSEYTCGIIKIKETNKSEA